MYKNTNDDPFCELFNRCSSETPRARRRLAGLVGNATPLGIAPPPTEEIAQKLHDIGDHWSDVHDMLLHVTTGVEIPDQERFDIYHELAVKLHAIEELEVLYQNYSKRIY